LLSWAGVMLLAEENWLTVAEACHVLGMAERTLRRHIQEGKIKSKLEKGRRLVLAEPAQSDMPGDMPETAVLVDQLRTENEHLRKQVNELQDQLSQSNERHDMIVMQLTRQLEQSQRLLSYHQAPWWRRWVRRGKQT